MIEGDLNGAGKDETPLKLWKAKLPNKWHRLQSEFCRWKSQTEVCATKSMILPLINNPATTKGLPTPPDVVAVCQLGQVSSDSRPIHLGLVLQVVGFHKPIDGPSSYQDFSGQIW